jgi:non-specific protein-tyrosine kinase
MKIRKALERARKERRLNRPEGWRTAVKTGNDTGSGWKPPVYSESMRAHPDRKTALNNRCMALFADTPDTEHYRILRTRIGQRMKQNGWNTMMITSVRPGEGKTLTSINLAVTLAREFSRPAKLESLGVSIRR